MAQTDQLSQLLKDTLNQDLFHIVMSNSVNKDQAFKVKIRPVLLKNGLFFQETLFRGTQVFHKNYKAKEMEDRILELMGGLFRQAQICSADREATVLISKKGKLTLKVKASVAARNKDTHNKAGAGGMNRFESKVLLAGKGKSAQDAKQYITDMRNPNVLSHNRVKHYILEDGLAVDFLVGLGVQTTDGRVTKAKYDKFRQINRYLEFIEDVLDELPTDRPIRIIDFGCGKSYLTFAMYHYLHELQHRDIHVTGLDLKEDVIAHCSRLARECGYEGLTFEKGDISSYEGTDQADMVVSLHACDTATDFAIEKAVKWGAKVIMAVPCCQHEVNRQIKCDQLNSVLRYGVIKERMSALITDALRAAMLEQQGYETQILEFIDMEHTPKNLLIRAVKKPGMRPKGKGDIRDVLDLLQISPSLYRLLES